jgi:D-alanyl-D-alanine carboxypeptidase (penicillin-binding protein 5/6)
LKRIVPVLAGGLALSAALAVALAGSGLLGSGGAKATEGSPANAIAASAASPNPIASGSTPLPAAVAVPGAPDPLAAPVPRDVPIALLVDLATGQTLFSRDADRRFVPASTTKVMTAFTAFNLVADGTLPLDRMVVITPELERDWWAEGSTMFLKAGDRVTVAQLLMGITTVSANDASVALGVEAVGSLGAWLALMNANAAALGMRDTHFGTPNGWPDEGRTFSSASDMARLGEALVSRHPDLYRRFFGQRGMVYREIAQNNHDPVTGRVEGADGLKTGYTRQAGYNFIGSAERDGRRLMMVLAAVPTGRLRDKTARDLLDWGFAAFETTTLLAPGAQVGEAALQDGASRSVGLATQAPVMVSLRALDGPPPRLTIRYNGPVEAPVARGQRIATLRIETNDAPPHDVPLVATGDVPRANGVQRLLNGLAGPFS